MCTQLNTKCTTVTYHDILRSAICSTADISKRQGLQLVLCTASGLLLTNFHVLHTSDSASAACLGYYS